ARRFARGLAEFGHVVLWDENSLVPGFDWRRVARENLARADGVVVLLSANAVKAETGKVTSQWIAAEVGAARATDKFVIPVLIGAALPMPELVSDLRVARVDSERTADVEAGLRLVASAVERHLEVRTQIRSLDLPVGYQHLAPYVELCRKDVAFD